MLGRGNGERRDDSSWPTFSAKKTVVARKYFYGISEEERLGLAGETGRRPEATWRHYDRRYSLTQLVARSHFGRPFVS
jgi:hypothetical protein